MALYGPSPTPEVQVAALARRMTRHDAGMNQCMLCCVPEECAEVAYGFGKAEITKAEVQGMKSLFSNRESAIRHGLSVAGQRFEVYQHHSNIIMGRESEGDCGFTLLRQVDKATGKAVYVLATYAMPLVGTEVAAVLRQACDEVFDKGVLLNMFA